MTLTEKEIPEFSRQRIGAITRDELNEHTFDRIERVWGALITALLTSSECTDMTQLPIYVPEVLKYMVAEVHFTITVASRAITASLMETLLAHKSATASRNQSMSDQLKIDRARPNLPDNRIETETEVLDAASKEHDEHKQNVALYDEYISDVNKMNEELLPLLNQMVNDAEHDFVEDEWYDIMHPDPTRSFETFKHFFLPISQSKLKAWAEWVCLKKAWLEYLALTHCCGRSFLRALDRQCIMFDVE